MVGRVWSERLVELRWPRGLISLFRVGAIPQRRGEQGQTQFPYFELFCVVLHVVGARDDARDAGERFFVVGDRARHPSARLSRNKFVRSAHGEALDSIASTH